MKKLFSSLVALMLAFVILIPTNAYAYEENDIPENYECQHDLLSYIRSEEIDSKYHESEYMCDDCGELIYKKEKHNNLTSYMDSEPEKIDSKYHRTEYICDDCGGLIYRKEKHIMKWYKEDGSWCYGCKACYYDEFSAYLDYTVAYKNKKYVKVYLDGSVYKGDTLKVKIGKKTYKKKIKKSANCPMYKLKIKKPKKNSKIKVYMYHKGKRLSFGYEYVMTSYNPKKGMSKWQVKNYTMWGSPDDTMSSSNGYSYWYWDDGSYIVFKKGKVKYWYG